jgi:hypothetical protein
MSHLPFVFGDLMFVAAISGAVGYLVWLLRPHR